uniref:Interleukin-1 n=1 Tax=Astyanax mexicanus TaxID=7994 RepID=A0A3B1JWD5_ASTMX
YHFSMCCSLFSTLSGRCDLHRGLRIEISQHPHSMRKVANIVIGLQRLQKFRHAEKVSRSTEFTEHELLNIILESVVEETVVMRLSCDSPQVAHSFTSIRGSLIVYIIFFNETDSFNVNNCDLNSIFFPTVRMNLSTYASPSCNSTKGQPVCLGIAKSNLYLSCTESDSGSPHLSLEEVKNKEELKMIRGEDGLKRFLFLRSVKGGSVNTFESARFPGWFISTATEDYQPVEMCAEADTSRQRVFTLLP